MAASSFAEDSRKLYDNESQQLIDHALVYAHYAYPIALLLLFLVLFTARSIRTAPKDTEQTTSLKTGPGGKPLPASQPAHSKPKPKVKDDIPKSQKRTFEIVSILTALTFCANAAVVILHAIIDRDEQWWCGKAKVVYLAGAFFVYLLFYISLIDTKPSPTSVHFTTWSVAAFIEILLLGASLQYYTHRHREPTAGDRPGKWRTQLSMWEGWEVAFDLLRVLLLLSLVVFFAIFVWHARQKQKRKERDAQHASETQGLLQPEHAENGSANGYGSVHANGKPSAGHSHADGWSRPTTTPARNWWEYMRGYSVFFPYLWPSNDQKLQLIVIFCFVLVALQRVVNFMVPYQIDVITNALAHSHDEGTSKTPWGAICIFIALKLLQGSNGILGALRASLWIPISQYSYRELSVAAFEHVHGLSLDFHLGKKTGEVLSALGKGSSINTFLEQVTFSVVPMLVDLVVAFIYFLINYDAYYALVVAVVTFWYIYITIRMAQWRTDVRREMVNADRETDAVKNDSMVSYETVKYFNAENYEFQRYRGAVNKYQKAEYKVLWSLNVMNISQNMVFMLGLMVACFIAAYQITTGQREVGLFTGLIVYMAQLQSPLNFFGTFYRMIQNSMINSERLLELFKEQPTVVDQPNARELPSCEGDLRFNDVHFNYDHRKPALQGLDFRCPPGTTTALVGESGGGKSTVFRLLFRFYNAASGSLQIDGHDVQDVTIDSVRRHIGVVPQDTVLFNETVMYNLRYARPDATDEEVYAACRAASIHDKIMSFPDQYETRVGDRGLRLSGGEKQRVAIARTIIKDPRIILLDEATAALDTETEEHIQEALTTLGQGRTMLVIAHRLSTITTADQILVLHEGRVDERGTHEELLERGGRYSKMWKKQIRAQRAAEEANRLKEQAERLQQDAKNSDMDEEASGSSEDEKRQRSQASKSAER